MVWSATGPQGSESAKCRWDIVPYTRGIGVDLGCGSSKPFPHFLGVDSNIDAQLFGAEARDRGLTVPTCESLPMFASESLDFVFSSHLLEHIQDYRGALKEWWRIVKPGGHLVLYLPHKSFYPNIGQPGSNPDHKHDFMPADIIEAMPGAWDLLVNEDRSEDNEYAFLQVYRKQEQMAQSWRQPKPARTCAVIRYGAYGDVLQSASILPGLKAQGYHVTFFCTPRGIDAIRHDPHIDAFVVQDEDQVPNHELSSYFSYLEKRFDKVINLCETVEGIVLPLSFRAHYHWPKEARHMICNRNYVELQHSIAGVPFSLPQMRFYPTEAEHAWALAQRSEDGPTIAWALSGSAPHKVWPYVDPVLEQLLIDYPRARVAFLGGNMEAMLQEGWEQEERVLKCCGVWSIRQAMAFAQVCDVVIGPETGVLNAVAMEDCAKVLMLSHSTIENLCRDWRNTFALVPDHEQATCYPCHRLHTEGWKYCNRHPGGGAVCQVSIGPGLVYMAIQQALQRKERAHDQTAEAGLQAAEEAECE